MNKKEQQQLVIESFKHVPELLQKYLREEFNIRVFIRQGVSGNFVYEIFVWDNPNQIGKWTRIGNFNSYNTYELALEAGLQEGLTLIK